MSKTLSFANRQPPQRSQFVPHSWHKGWQRGPVSTYRLKKAIRSFFDDPAPRISNERYQYALQRARRDFKLPVQVKAQHINDVIRSYKHPERSACLPWIERGYTRKDEIPPYFIKKYQHGIKYWKWKITTPCVAIGRSHLHPTKKKTRLVWGYPGHVTYCEGIFAQPLIEAYKQVKGPYTIWVQFSKGHMRHLQNGVHWIGNDFDSFDSTVPAWLIRDAFSILEDNIDFTQYLGETKVTSPEALHQLWRELIRYFINTPIIVGDTFYRKDHGIPSGSFFTNMIGSVCNAIAHHYVLDLHGSRYFHGDDSKVAHPPIDPSLMIEKFLEFGLKLNVDKCEQGARVSYLGFQDQHGVPVAKTDKLFEQASFPASPDKTLDDAKRRVYALVLCSFGTNSTFYEEASTWLRGWTGDPPFDMLRTIDILGLDIHEPVTRLRARLCL